MKLMKQNEIDEKQTKVMTKGLTRNEMTGQTFIFFLAGYETTATTLTWALYELCRDLDLQDRLRDEIQNLNLANRDDLKDESMPNLSAVIKETLGIHSPVQIHIRRCTQTVHLGDKTIHKGTNIDVPVHTLHTMKEYWGEDGHLFNHQRWIDNKNLEKETFYMPFGDGPRNCIGLRFANMMTRSTLATMIKNFKVTFADGFIDDVKQIALPSTLLGSSKPIEIKFEKI